MKIHADTLCNSVRSGLVASQSTSQKMWANAGAKGYDVSVRKRRRYIYEPHAVPRIHKTLASPLAVIGLLVSCVGKPLKWQRSALRFDDRV